VAVVQDSHHEAVIDGHRSGSPLLALALLVPVPSLGTYLAMVATPGSIGQLVFGLCKLWILVLPVLWWVLVDKGKLSWSPPRHGGLLMGAGLGVAVAGVILLAYLCFGRELIDAALMRTRFVEIGLTSPIVYLAGAAYWILINSVLEEYVYRWFIYSQCARLMPGGVAVGVSALVFTVHHVVALNTYLSPWMTALAAVGVFVGGALWSWCYHRYRSIWPGWLCHLGADLAIFAIGWQLVFA